MHHGSETCENKIALTCQPCRLTASSARAHNAIPIRHTLYRHDTDVEGAEGELYNLTKPSLQRQWDVCSELKCRCVCYKLKLLLPVRPMLRNLSEQRPLDHKETKSIGQTKAAKMYFLHNNPPFRCHTHLLYALGDLHTMITDPLLRVANRTNKDATHGAQTAKLRG